MLAMDIVYGHCSLIVAGPMVCMKGYGTALLHGSQKKWPTGFWIKVFNSLLSDSR